MTSGAHGAFIPAANLGGLPQRHELCGGAWGLARPAVGDGNMCILILRPLDPSLQPQMGASMALAPNCAAWKCRPKNEAAQLRFPFTQV